LHVLVEEHMFDVMSRRAGTVYGCAGEEMRIAVVAGAGAHYESLHVGYQLAVTPICFRRVYSGCADGSRR
jgi:hypothetical protein